jgi:hypothetical protein
MQARPEGRAFVRTHGVVRKAMNDVGSIRWIDTPAFAG